MRAIAKVFLILLGLILAAAAVFLVPAHLQVRGVEPELPSEAALRALSSGGDRPVSVRYVATSEQELPGRLGHTTIFVEWANGKLFMIDAGMDRDAAGGRETVRRIEALGGEAVFIEADVSDAEQVEAMVRQTISSFGALHCASNNAAEGAGFRFLTDIEQAKWQRALDVTLSGVWLCMKYEIPAMLESGGGAIVNIASVSGMRGESLQPTRRWRSSSVTGAANKPSETVSASV